MVGSSLVKTLDRAFEKGRWSAEKVLDWLLSILGSIHIGLATSIIVGGEQRFKNPSLRPLYHLVDGQVWVWGFWIFVSGILIISPFKTGEVIGLWLGMCWHFFWMACVTVAVIRIQNAAATTIPVYGGFALICTVLLTAKVLDLVSKE